MHLQTAAAEQLHQCGNGTWLGGDGCLNHALATQLMLQHETAQFIHRCLLHLLTAAAQLLHQRGYGLRHTQRSQHGT
jgi:hypothetical protein